MEDVEQEERNYISTGDVVGATSDANLDDETLQLQKDGYSPLLRKLNFQEVTKSKIERLEELRAVRGIVNSNIQKLRAKSENTEKLCKELRKRINFTKEKTRFLGIPELETEKADCQDCLESLKKENLFTVDKILEFGFLTQATLIQLNAEVSSEFNQFKSWSCLKNGTNTMIHRAEEYKKQLSKLEEEIYDLKTKLTELRDNNVQKK